MKLDAPLPVRYAPGMENYRPASDGGLRPNDEAAAVTVARHVTGKAHPTPTEIAAAYGGSRAIEAVMRDEAKRS